MAQSDWRPIETLDAVRYELFLGWNKTGGVAVCLKGWTGRTFRVTPNGTGGEVRPTHWMPLPDPPESEEENDD